MTQDAIQFSGDVFVVSGRASPACFTGRHVTPLPSVTSPRPWTRADMKVSCSAFSTGTKASLMPGVILRMNEHYCWSDFCSPT